MSHAARMPLIMPASIRGRPGSSVLGRGLAEGARSRGGLLGSLGAAGGATAGFCRAWGPCRTDGSPSKATARRP